jgi:hypothetical protein
MSFENVSAYQNEKVPVPYDRDAAMRAKAEVESEVDMRSQGMEGGSTLENKIIVLELLLSEYGAVKPGTRIPVDNSKGSCAEAAAFLLNKAEAEKVYKDTIEKMEVPVNKNDLQKVAV